MLRAPIDLAMMGSAAKVEMEEPPVTEPKRAERTEAKDVLAAEGLMGAPANSIGRLPIVTGGWKTRK